MDDLFYGAVLPTDVEALLRDTNPWWFGKPGPRTPRFRRTAFDEVLGQLKAGPAPCVALRGPRQVGKTTIQGQLVDHLVRSERVQPRHILRVQFDELPPVRRTEMPIQAITRWFQRVVMGMTFNEAALAGQTAYLLLDEVQNLREWAPQVKSLVDHHDVRVMVTGSSSLRIEAGQDSLAGRVRYADLGPLSLREIAELRFRSATRSSLEGNDVRQLADRGYWHALRNKGEREAELRNQAFEAFSERGAYPRAQAESAIPWPMMADHLNDTVINRAIVHDLRMGERGRKRDEQLLKELFRLACRYAGQAPGKSVFVPEVKQALDANVGWQRVTSYLDFLERAMLIRRVLPLEIRLKRPKGSAKLCLCDHALRASWLQEVVPLAPAALAQNEHMRDIAGHLAESAAGYFLSTIPGLDLAHFPERGPEPEVDFVLTIGTTRIPLEVKYRNRIDELEDTRGLRSFLEKTVYNAPFGVLVTMHDEVPIADPRIVQIPLSTLLWMR
ncbi:MAG: ATP-binding protein [Armatimonadetes bacterium]|nr:ATP-binding protein [Armatimonadota bacterium]